jgi:NAD(P)-dependent dehydrogenase (short-subunit alcohol dehydrogenase family)
MSRESGVRRRRALVVGGSGGIGRAISHRLSALGIDVVATGAHREKLDSLGNEFPGRIEGIQAAGDRPEQLLSLLPESLEPDILVCSFGPVIYKPVGETTLDDWRYLAGMNLVLPGALITRFLPGMRRRGFGRILLFGVMGSEKVRGYREIGAYAAAKTGLMVVLRSLAKELSGTNIAVSALLPGYVETEYLTPEEKQRFLRRTASQELKKPAEIAETACYVITAEDNRHNGALFPLG